MNKNNNKIEKKERHEMKGYGRDHVEMVTTCTHILCFRGSKTRMISQILSTHR